MIGIALNKGHVAIIDDDCAHLSRHTWQVVARSETLFYASRHVCVEGKKTKVFLHHEVLGTRQRTDHVNGDGLDCRRRNLRPATQQQNCANARLSRANRSGFKGVALHKHAQRWTAQVTVNRKKLHLGYFDNARDAARAYDKAAMLHFGAFAKTNFPRAEYEAAQVWRRG